MNRVSLFDGQGGRAEGGGACDGENRTHALFKQSLCPPFSGLAEVMNANENRLGLFPFEEFLERLVLLQKHHSEEEKCGLSVSFFPGARTSISLADIAPTRVACAEPMQISSPQLASFNLTGRQVSGARRPHALPSGAGGQLFG